uniref:Uncharacterized mitochondrial protein AtMg00810-like n=1 Tax=Nicotiana tabacum TaxID=4097 RepID=A0A1S3ZWX7_TOBAC|nr:PREDICTED: uncharacterized mitochondrial protein AtMg00810-like [Nicotiana tabacum]
MTTIRSIIVVAVKKGWNMFQLDINNGFLHGDLDEEVYMKIPQVSKNDYSLFIKSGHGLITIVAVYVDDILLSENFEKEMSSLKLLLDHQFKIKDLGLIHYFLGLEVLSEPGGVIVCQRKFALDLLTEFNYLDSTPVASPMDVTMKFKANSEELLPDPTLYRKLVGKLNFLTNTRPDLAFSVQFLSQFMHTPSSSHLTAAFHVLKYVKGTLGQGLLMSNDPDLSLQAYCNSDCATCPHSRKSASEYRSMHRVVAELAWLTRLLNELSVASIVPVPLHCDSQSAIYIARNHVFHECTKHIELGCHFVREKLHEGLISLSFVPSRLQLADMLTKALPGVAHRSILSKLGVANHPPT